MSSPVSNVRGCSGSLSLSDKKRELLLPLLTHRARVTVVYISQQKSVPHYSQLVAHTINKKLCVFSKLRSLKLKNNIQNVIALHLFFFQCLIFYVSFKFAITKHKMESCSRIVNTLKVLFFIELVFGKLGCPMKIPNKRDENPKNEADLQVKQ